MATHAAMQDDAPERTVYFDDYEYRDGELRLTVRFQNLFTEADIYATGNDALIADYERYGHLHKDGRGHNELVQGFRAEQWQNMVGFATDTLPSVLSAEVSERDVSALLNFERRNQRFPSIGSMSPPSRGYGAGGDFTWGMTYMGKNHPYTDVNMFHFGDGEVTVSSNLLAADYALLEPVLEQMKAQKAVLGTY